MLRGIGHCGVNAHGDQIRDEKTHLLSSCEQAAVVLKVVYKVIFTEQGW
jgi:hypothetical protein